MMRTFPLLLSLILAAGLWVSTGLDGYVRATHALAQAGQVQLVICGSSGVEEITLNRDGTQVPSEKTNICTHCADCSVTPIAQLGAEHLQIFHSSQIDVLVSAIVPEFIHSHKVWRPSRGPPLQSKV